MSFALILTIFIVLEIDMKPWKTFISTITCLLIAHSAHAGLIDVSGGEESPTPGGNDIIPAGIDGYYHGPTLALTATGDVDLVFTFFGYEAAHRNIFLTPDGAFQNRDGILTAASSTGDTIVSTQNGVLDFGFVDVSSCGFLCVLLGGDPIYASNGGDSYRADFWTGMVAV